METLVRFRQWLFSVDKEATAKAYAAVEASGADTCPCDDCRNFVLQRLAVYPAEILEFFLQVGIDYRKESEVYSFGEVEDGLYSYGGWLHFVGQIVDGEDWQTAQQWERLSETFSLGFTASYAPTILIGAPEPLVQIELFFKAPWIL